MYRSNSLLSIIILTIISLPSINLRAQKQTSLPNPKNIIILIGDGMGFNHITATNYYQGVKQQVYQQFPVQLAMAHNPAKAGEYDKNNPAKNYFAPGYNGALAWKDTAYLKRDYTESAAAATALATGVKTYNNSVGMSVDFDTLENLVQRSKSIGKSAGVVTSVEFSHATPAGFVAHNTVRSNYSQLVYDMLLDSRCDVIMGCGDPMFDDEGLPVGKKWMNSKYVGDSVFWTEIIAGSGKRTHFSVMDKANSVSDINGDGKPDPWTVIRTRDEFRDLQKGKTPLRVLGCPKVNATLQQGRQMKNGETKDSRPYVNPFITTVPTLAEMAAGALNVLDNNSRGFFLMIEGGAIDWASHSSLKGRLIEEMTFFNEAVNYVVSWVNTHSNWDETLVVVTGDHETGLLWGERPFVPLADRGKGNLPLMNFNTTDHTNSLIPFYARGAGSELYRTYADERDSVRGPYIQNAEVAQLIKLLWNK